MSGYTGFHLAGILPVSGQKLEFNMPWHDSLMPIAPDYLAIERSVVECAYAGCETIWIVCNDDMQPLIRHRLGDYVNDPVMAYRGYLNHWDKFQEQGSKPIPIYYVPIHPNDRNKKDCLGWSVLYGAYTSWKIARRLSKWLVPSRFYVSFPYGVYDPSALRKYRKQISSNEGFLLSFDGETVVDGQMLGFTFTPEQSKELTYEFKRNATSLYKNYPSDGMVKEKLDRYSIEERYSGRFFSIKDIFGTLDTSSVEIVAINKSWDISTWGGYCNYISEHGKDIQRPSENILKYKEFNGIGVDS